MTATEHHTPGDYTAPAVPVDYAPLRRTALLSAVVGLGAWAVLGAVNGHLQDVYLSYLVGFVYWISLPLGAMTLLFLAYLTHASWGLVLRRVFQACTRTLPLFAVLFLPVLISLYSGKESPFWWVNPAHEALGHEEGHPANTHTKARPRPDGLARADDPKPPVGDVHPPGAVGAHTPKTNKDTRFAVEEVEHRQHLYLNVPRFVLMAVACFAVWWALISCLNRWAPRSEDEGDKSYLRKLQALAGPGIILWALTWTFAVTDWVMSVEFSWSSTMFPVVTAMNQFLMALCFGALVLYTLAGDNAVVMGVIKDKFRIDIGSLMLGFCMIWAYASFSQFMLIWAGNLPEEIGYYRKRLYGGWEWMARLLSLVHWLLPFVILLFRGVKTSPRAMRRVTLFLLAICAVDVTWWIMPAYPHPDRWLHVPMAFAAVVGIGGVFGLVFLSQLSRKNLLPAKDTEFLATWGEHH